MDLENLQKQLKRILATGKRATGANLKKCISQLETVVKENEEIFKSDAGKEFYDKEIAPILERGIVEQLKTYTKIIENNRNWCNRAKDAKKAKQYLDAMKKELEKQQENIKKLGEIGEKYLQEITEFINTTETKVAGAIAEDQLKAITGIPIFVRSPTRIAKIDGLKKKVDYYINPKSSYVTINKAEIEKRINEIKAVVEKEKTFLESSEAGKKLISDLEVYYKEVNEGADKVEKEQKRMLIISQILPTLSFELDQVNNLIRSFDKTSDENKEDAKNYIMSEWKKVSKTVNQYLYSECVKNDPQVEAFLSKYNTAKEDIDKINDAANLLQRIKSDAKVIQPGPEEFTKLPYRNLDEESMHSNWERLGKKYCGKIVFATKKIEDESDIKQEFEQGDEIHAKAFWLHAIRNYPLGVLDGKPVYGPESLGASYEIKLYDVDFIPSISVNGEKQQTLKPDGTPYKFSFDGRDEEYNPYKFHQHLDFILRKDYPKLVDQIEVFSLWLTKILSELKPGKHTITVDLSFRLRSIGGSIEMEYKTFPRETTPISAPIASGSFTINVKSKVAKPKIADFKSHQRNCKMSDSEAEKLEKIITDILLKNYATDSKDLPQYPVYVRLRDDWRVSETNLLHQPIQFKLLAIAVLERKKSDGWPIDSYMFYYNILALTERYEGVKKEIDKVMSLYDWPLRADVPKILFE